MQKNIFWCKIHFAGQISVWRNILAIWANHSLVWVLWSHDSWDVLKQSSKIKYKPFLKRFEVLEDVKPHNDPPQRGERKLLWAPVHCSKSHATRKLSSFSKHSGPLLCGNLEINDCILIPHKHWQHESGPTPAWIMLSKVEFSAMSCRKHKEGDMSQHNGEGPDPYSN